jgi:hypothetical protein
MSKRKKSKRRNKRKKLKLIPVSLHPGTHRLIAMALAGAGDARFTATLARLILLLESYRKVNPVIPSTPVGSATDDVDILAADINERWDFPAGKKFRNGDIIGTTITQTLARDIHDRGGVVNGN